MRKHRVKQGECMDSIAATYGFSSGRALLDHPQNAELKKMRPDPGMLLPGDEVVIPDRKAKATQVKAGAAHSVQVKTPRRLLRLTLLDGTDQAFANQVWAVMDSAGEVLAAGETDADGKLEAELAGSAQELTVHCRGVEFQVHLGALDPLRDGEAPCLSGVRARLRNLGYDSGPDVEGGSTQLQAVIGAFQRQCGLEPTGELDGATLDKLREVHGC